MSELAIILLHRHKANQSKVFYADPFAADSVIKQYGFVALDASYAELVAAGFVVAEGFTTTQQRVGRPTYQITATGEDAVGIAGA